jgi:hypothetical protein
MPTPLHAADALHDLAGGAPGPARDWALVQLAGRGLPVPGLPDDRGAVRIALAGGAPTGPLLDRVRAGGGKTELEAVSGTCEDLVLLGRLPDDRAPWIEALRAAIRGRGWPSDARFAMLLAELGGLDDDALQAAVRVEDPVEAFALPRLVLGWTEAKGRELRAPAAEIARALAPRMAGDPALLPAVLCSFGIPRAAPDRPLQSVDEALYLGGTLGGADETPPVSAGRGSVRRRMQGAARELLAGAPQDAAHAMVAALLEADVDAALLLVAATWLRCAGRGDPLAAVVDHGAGEDPNVLTAAVGRAAEVDPAALGLSLATRWLGDPPSAALIGPVLARRAPGSASAEALATSVADRGMSALHEPRIQAALALALPRCDAVERWFARGGARSIALYHAHNVASEGVLEALLALDPPAEPHQREWYALALADMGDRGACAALDRLVERFPAEAPLAAEQARAHAILGS